MRAELLANDEVGLMQTFVMLRLIRLFVEYCSAVVLFVSSISRDAWSDTTASRPVTTLPSKIWMSSAGNPAWMRLSMIAWFSSAGSCAQPNAKALPITTNAVARLIICIVSPLVLDRFFLTVPAWDREPVATPLQR